MTGEKVDFSEAANAAREAGDDKSKRERSLIDFPYVSLEGAVEVARAIYSRCAFSSCDQDELAAEMGQTLSGAFRMKTGAAKTFALVEKDGRSAFRLSDIGKRIVAPETERSARVEAFLAVPLYNQIYEKFRGHNLPPMKALEREMETLGVPAKQTDRARQAFERSAQYAGFSDSGKDRLVRPRMEQTAASESAPVAAERSTSVPPQERRAGGGDDGNGNEPPSIDPIIRGLIGRLPPAGSHWPKAKRKLWLQILENSFDLVYEDDSDKGDAFQ
ncbi:MAG: hypothetical protein EOQ64_02350 [Mesorhizobium sp.]|uniref:hypothetical protein n=1 Tax=unclassified Mesorhizobium TaxID=325217 RepID=UPI000FE83389|nr:MULTISPECIES: hypothetical protein [unclassified Mesorhizobium]MDG4899676.1 hypothetical protein [Mesorhizobium sp. WSM4962]MDG4918087.1 hypothetical protein [Mesorhizobium sp. WSM4989]RWG60381.1 MAG: hypothetical protein EOQ64_02350 [Mesorhizobium sp.]RWH43860.1 MAG: hypothetical protein EOQ78_12050 [Mesorhizobium sp.]RWI24335.1 MAG: hypothetical protein EOQ94_01220 [Mesorhizobium sp.]